MKIVCKMFSVVVLIILLSGTSFSQDIYLKGRSALEMNFGFWGGPKASNTATSTGIRSDANTGGFQGDLLYSYWIREHVAVTLSTGFLAGGATSTVTLSPVEVNQTSSAIMPVLIGVRYYLFDPAPDDAVRPLVSAAIGAYIGSEASSTMGSQQAFSETAFGGQFGVGVDFFLSNHIKLGANVRYNLMSDFTPPVGARSNYDGGDASLGLGYIF